MQNISNLADFLDRSPNLREHAEDLYFEKRLEEGFHDEVWQTISPDQQIEESYIPAEVRPSSEDIVNYFMDTEDDSLIELIDELEDEIL